MFSQLGYKLDRWSDLLLIIISLHSMVSQVLVQIERVYEYYATGFPFRIIL